MTRLRNRVNEGAWVTVARKRLPNHLSWPGFCRTLGWPGHVPNAVRISDNHLLRFYIRAARALGINTAWFVSEIIAELKRRSLAKPPGPPA